jgi:hypothetical protein
LKQERWVRGTADSDIMGENNSDESNVVRETESYIMRPQNQVVTAKRGGNGHGRKSSLWAKRVRNEGERREGEEARSYTQRNSWALVPQTRCATYSEIVYTP